MSEETSALWGEEGTYEYPPVPDLFNLPYISGPMPVTRSQAPKEGEVLGREVPRGKFKGKAKAKARGLVVRNKRIPAARNKSISAAHKKQKAAELRQKQEDEDLAQDLKEMKLEKKRREKELKEASKNPQHQMRDAYNVADDILDLQPQPPATMREPVDYPDRPDPELERVHVYPDIELASDEWPVGPVTDPVVFAERFRKLEVEKEVFEEELRVDNEKYRKFNALQAEGAKGEFLTLRQIMVEHGAKALEGKTLQEKTIDYSDFPPGKITGHDFNGNFTLRVYPPPMPVPQYPGDIEHVADGKTVVYCGRRQWGTFPCKPKKGLMIPPGITAVGDDFYDPNSLYRDHIQYDGDGPGSAETDEIDNEIGVTAKAICQKIPQPQKYDHTMENNGPSNYEMGQEVPGFPPGEASTPDYRFSFIEDDRADDDKDDRRVLQLPPGDASTSRNFGRYLVSDEQILRNVSFQPINPRSLHPDPNMVLATNEYSDDAMDIDATEEDSENTVIDDDEVMEEEGEEEEEVEEVEEEEVEEEEVEEGSDHEPVRVPKKTRACGIATPSKVPTGLAPFKPEYRGTANTVRKWGCVICNGKFKDTRAVRSHFAKCADKNGNPHAYCWYDHHTIDEDILPNCVTEWA